VRRIHVTFYNVKKEIRKIERSKRSVKIRVRKGLGFLLLRNIGEAKDQGNYIVLDLILFFSS